MKMFNVSDIVQAGGLLLVALIIFGESGMFIGFFFPGDTLLLSAGIFAAQGKLEIAALLPTVALAAILGDNIGYLIGKRYGRQLFDRPNSIIFKREYLRQSEAFFARYGSRAMMLAHFVPVVRTFAPATAGLSRMDHKKFFMYDAIGDTAWAIIVTMIGYWFGQRIPNIDHYILLAVGGVMILTLGPTFYHLTKALIARRRAAKIGESK